MKKSKNMKLIAKKILKKKPDLWCYDTEGGSDIRIFKNNQFMGYMQAEPKKNLVSCCHYYNFFLKKIQIG